MVPETIEAGFGVVLQAAKCDSHPVHIDFTKDDVATCLLVESSCSHGTASAGTLCRSYCDTSSESILVLKDGRYVMAHESSDTTGHGCQCSGSVDVYPDRAEFLKLGITDEQREDLIFQVRIGMVD